jgi:hypothetical protein
MGRAEVRVVARTPSIVSGEHGDRVRLQWGIAAFAACFLAAGVPLPGAAAGVALARTGKRS